jgi:3-oxoacyl-[acyl-carrier protein] reductase
MANEREFAGRLALITGSSQGIGAETALGLARGGARVLIHYHSAETAAGEVLAQVRAEGGDGELLRADLSTLAGTDALIQAVRERPVDILVNNAGSLIQRTKILEMSLDLWERTMMLNLTSAFLLSQALVGGMAERGWGVIVNVGSIAGRNGGGVGATAYATAKGALSTMTKGFSKEFAARGVRVNCISPGTVDTNFHRQFSTAQMLDAVRAATPVGRLGDSAENADVILFLCGEGARFIHGQTIEVNGGFYML